jgi:transcriptional regulator with XRE-family HTH domain
MDIGKRIRALREERGLTQREVARRAGLTPSGVGFIEHGQTRNPSAETVVAVARALGVPVEELLREPVPLDEAPEKAGLADADPSSKLVEAEVLEEIAELWAAQLARGFFDRRTLGMMHMAGGILAMNHEAALGEDRENLPPNFLAQLEAAEERFVAVGTQIWEAIEEADHGHPTLPDELAARRKAKSEAREALRQQLRGAAPGEAEAN